MKRLGLACSLAAFGWSLSCGSSLPPVYRLDAPRILAIRAEPPELVPDGQVTLDALVYLPPGSAAKYQWSWCGVPGDPQNPASCGMSAQALTKSIDPDGSAGLQINYNLGTDSQAIISHPVNPDLLASVCPAFPFGNVSSADAGVSQAADGGEFKPYCIDPWPATVFLTVRSGDQVLVARRDLSIHRRPPASPNANPTIAGLAAPATDLSLPDGGVVPAGGVGLKADVPESASETITSNFTPPPDTSDAGTPPADDAGVAGGDDAGTTGAADAGTAPADQESLTLAWYVESGRLGRDSTSLRSARPGRSRDWPTFLSNWWLPDADLGAPQVEMILVLRDDRNGVAWLRQKIQPSK